MRTTSRTQPHAPDVELPVDPLGLPPPLLVYASAKDVSEGAVSVTVTLGNTIVTHPLASLASTVTSTSPRLLARASGSRRPLNTAMGPGSHRGTGSPRM